MIKRIGVVMLLLCCLLILTACGCEHVWLSATCQAPLTCTKCGETEGEVGDHTWQAATCEAAAACAVCGQTQGEPLPHDWVQSGCTAACKNCGADDPAAPGHQWIDATCEQPKQCSVCSLAEGEALPHEWIAADCNNPQRCADCATVEGSRLDHSLAAGNDGVTGLCTACGKAVEYFRVEGKVHAWTEYDVAADGSYVNPITYVKEKQYSDTFTPQQWFKDGILQEYEMNLGCSLYCVDGKVYYFYNYIAENPEAVVRALSNASSRYVSFSQATYSNMNCLNPILCGPGGWLDDTRGYVNAAVDAYGNPFAIVHKCPTSWEIPDDPTQTWAVACDWMK